MSPPTSASGAGSTGLRSNAAKVGGPGSLTGALCGVLSDSSLTSSDSFAAFGTRGSFGLLGVLTSAAVGLDTVPGTVPVSASDGVPDTVLESVPALTPEAPVTLSDGVSDGISDTIPGTVSVSVSDKVPDTVLDSVPASILGAGVRMPLDELLDELLIKSLIN